MKIISTILILVTAYLSIKHGWAGITMKAENADMFADLKISKSVLYVISILSLAIGVLIFFPQTFFAANLINAVVILLIMALSLRVGNIKIALIEIPFLLMPLLLIYLGHPLKR
jgi:hypothetical protein